MLQGLLPHVGVGHLGHRVAAIDPHEVDFGRLVLEHHLAKMREGNSLVLGGIGIALEGLSGRHERRRPAGVVHTVAFMADMPAEQRQIHLGCRGVSTVFSTLIASHILDDNGLLGVGVIASDAGDVVVGAAGLGLDGLLAPLVSLGLNESGRRPGKWCRRQDR